MYYQTFLRVLFGSLVLLFAERAFSQVTQPKSVLDIVSNRSIWGKDFSLALAQMEALSKAGDKTAELFPTKLTGSRRYANAQAAAAEVRTVDAESKKAARQDLFKKTKRNFPFEARMPNVEAIKSAESDSILVNLDFGQVAFLKPGVRINEVLKELGAAERVSNRIIEGRGEELPEILTYYAYANETIIFVESNFSTQPKLVSSVYFDTPKLVTALKNALK